MIKIAIVEDEETYTSQLKKYLSDFAAKKDLAFDIRTYNNAIDFLRTYASDCDIVFLDIKMPYMNGMTAAHKLRETDKHVSIIFITSLAQYAIEGYAVNATDYLLKPISYENFALKFSRALKLIAEKDADYIIVKEKESIVRIQIRELRFIESQGHHCVYHMGGGKTYTRYSSLKAAAKELEKFNFAYCNACFLVNLDFVRAIVGDVATVDDDELQISQAKKKSFIAAWKAAERI